MQRLAYFVSQLCRSSLCRVSPSERLAFQMVDDKRGRDTGRVVEVVDVLDVLVRRPYYTAKWSV